MENTKGRHKLKFVCVYGNPKSGGFVHDCLDHVAKQLRAQGAEVEQLEAEIKELTARRQDLQKEFETYRSEYRVK